MCFKPGHEGVHILIPIADTREIEIKGGKEFGSTEGEP